MTNPRRTKPPETAPLPASVLLALRAIRKDLRDLPRECVHDRAELIYWLNRMARRVEGVEHLRVAVDRTSAPRPQASPPTPIQVHNAAEAVFKDRSQPTAKRGGSRTVLSSKGRAVRVETKQLNLFGAPSA